MSKELAECNDTERAFIQALIENDGLPQKAAEAVGLTPMYGYQLRDKLAKAIIEAAQNYLASHSIKAAKTLVDHMDKEMPNPIHLQAAQGLLDRVGIIKHDPNANQQVQQIKANIFILPEKRPVVIDAEFSEDL